uniref:Methylmalonyl-CoA mutase n=1 Tax=Candidatus Kentrum sp. TUN TaxID=2126343 RepID=A0A450ZEH4_9GAMM|nr:MAG: methylmalonyl-CoA mutase [Candidatus Kentron sp. TUN]VFK52689.1 MAG: methylmalonyl-CoA mutase [Candidatus Kentron sp. TUN]VFK53249.1 MAG: methylmalonyl-CoA mutase [Candidatus Kentron sp. TUN]
MTDEKQNKMQGEIISFEEFPVPGYEQWRETAEKALKGASFEKKLITKTYEGIDLQPMYQRDVMAELPYADSLPGFAPYVRGTSALGYQEKPWEVTQELPYHTPAEFNKALRSDLERGQTAVNLVLDQATLMGEDADFDVGDDVGKGGVSIASLEDMEQAFEGVDLTKIHFLMQAGAEGIPVASFLFALIQKQGKSIEALDGCIGMDPLGTMARDGHLPRPLNGVYDGMAQLTRWAIGNAPKLHTISVQGHPYHDGGASATQELGFSLATAVEYLRQMQLRGPGIDEVAPRILFSFSLGANFFMEIAKLRAARTAWAKIVKAFGGNEESQKMRIHSRTSSWNKTLYDPHVNMLRATTEAFSGVIGGVDSMHIGPYDEVAVEPDDFSRRVARNAHTILREETYIPNTVDPAGGSWYVEFLTDTVAKQAWSILQKIEKEGGMFEALEKGIPQQEISEVADKRAADAAKRKTVFVGTNMYANINDKPLQPATDDALVALQRERAKEIAAYRKTVDANACKAALDKLAEAEPAAVVEAAIESAKAGATLGEISTTLAAEDAFDTVMKPIGIHRGAEAYEALRQVAKAYADKNGAPPKVFSANMGPIPQHKARADFSRGFLEVGGFDVIGNNGFETVEEAAKAAKDSGAPVVVICSTDKTYPDLVPPLTKLLKDGNPKTMVLLAGFPKDHVDSFREAGVDDFIFMGANCLGLIQKLQKSF